MLQDVFIFSESVAYNIRLGRTDIPDAQVQRAAERVGADRFIELLPHAFGMVSGFTEYDGLGKPVGGAEELTNLGSNEFSALLEEQVAVEVAQVVFPVFNQ